MIDIFEQMKKYGVEQVVFNYDKTSGAMAITAIHDTTLGPALGGTRMLMYESTDDALIDALRLSQGMTLKCSAAGMNFGGGKTVIIGDHDKDKNELVFRALGKFVEQFHGRYYTGTDMGTQSQDFVWASQETGYLIGLSEAHGGSGDTSITTSYGVFRGIQASAKEAYGTDSLEGIKVAVQGLGKVGSMVVDRLHEAGAHIIIDDYKESSTKVLLDQYPDLQVVDYRQIHSVDCHVFSPCAGGAVVNDQTIDQLNCDIIAGGANNQLADPKYGQALKEKGIIYAPDFVINSGGLIQVATEAAGEDTDPDKVLAKVSNIYDILLDIYKIAKDQDISTDQAAVHLAQDRIDKIGQMNNRLV